jgi:hypothetical protein
MDRWDFLKVSLPKYLDNPYIDEIIISDENGNDKTIIDNTYANNQKIRTFKNDRVLGAFFNKRRAVSLANNEFVCLMDSDNFAPISYFETWEKYLNGAQPDINTVYSPCKTTKQVNHPGFDHSELNSLIINKSNFKYCWKNYRCTQGAFNTGNFIISKTLMAKGEPYDRAMAVNSKSLDVLYQNYLLFTLGECNFILIPNMEYDHIVHDGSYYNQTSHMVNIPLYNSLYE